MAEPIAQLTAQLRQYKDCFGPADEKKRVPKYKIPKFATPRQREPPTTGSTKVKSSSNT